MKQPVLIVVFLFYGLRAHKCMKKKKKPPEIYNTDCFFLNDFMQMYNMNCDFKRFYCLIKISEVHVVVTLLFAPYCYRLKRPISTILNDHFT